MLKFWAIKNLPSFLPPLPQLPEAAVCSCRS